MFNRKEWASIFKNAYGIESKRTEGVLLFDVRKGREMNLVGDYIEKPSTEFFKKANGTIRVDSKPSEWNSVQNLETYRLKTGKSWERLLKEDIHQKTRNLINKAAKNFVETTLEDDEISLHQYYKMYTRTMLRISAIPQSYRLFKEMWRAFGSKDMKVFLSRHDDKIVAGIVALYDKKNKRLHIWSNAQKKSARSVSANMGCYGAVLKYACEHDEIEEVDFGNTKPGSSLAFFKARFGAKATAVWTVSSEPLRDGEVPKWPAKILFYLPTPCVSLISHLLFRFIR